MLVLTRKKREVLLLGRDIQVTVLSIHKNHVKLGINAPAEVRIYRKETRAKMSEQIPNTACRPSLLKGREDRIRAVLGLQPSQPLEVNARNTRKYYEFLGARLSLPFEARCPEMVESGKESVRTVTVINLLDPTIHTDTQMQGLVCQAQKDDQLVEVPLAELEVAEEDLDHQLIEDYWYWFWNFEYRAGLTRAAR